MSLPFDSKVPLKFKQRVYCKMLRGREVGGREKQRKSTSLFIIAFVSCSTTLEMMSLIEKIK